MLYVIEGPDGCGKSTVAKLLAQAISGEVIEFPRNEGYTGPLIRSYLRKEWDISNTSDEADIDDIAAAMTFQCLQVANRMEVMKKIRRHVKSAKDHLVLVRYWQSGVVYGLLDGLDRQWLRDIHEDMAQADLNILLDLSPEESLKRQKTRGDDPERYEGRKDITSRIIGSYRDLWEPKIEASGGFPGGMPEGRTTRRVGWAKVNASGPLEEVFAEVMSHVWRDR